MLRGAAQGVSGGFAIEHPELWRPTGTTGQEKHADDFVWGDGVIFERFAKVLQRVTFGDEFAEACH